MADYYAILKRAISGLAEPTGESRRSVYEKARTALVAQLKSFDPPLSASEITQQRLQLEDAIRKVESESAKGLLSQALNRASLPERPAPAPALSPPPDTAPEPVAQSRPARMTPPTGQPVTAAFSEPTSPPPAQEPVTSDRANREPVTGPARPPLAKPQLTPPTTTAGMRVTRPQFEPVARASAQPERITGPLPASGPMPPPVSPSAMPPPPGRDRAPTGNTQRRLQNDPTGKYEQEDVTQPVANRVLKKAVNDIDRLGGATQQSARRARDALAVTETPLDEELSTSGSALKKGSRKPLTARDRPPADLPGRGLPPGMQARKRGSRWPMIIGLVVAALVVGLGATALYTKRDLIASYLGTQKPILEMVQRTSSEKPIVKSTDRLLPDDATSKSPTAGVKVVTTQPISPGTDPSAPGNPGGKTDVTPTTPAQTPPAPAPASTPTPAAPSTAATPGTPPSTPPAPLPSGDIPPIAQKASLLEEAADGTSAPLQTPGKVIWQIVTTPSGQPDKPDVVRLQGRVEIPGRGIVMFVTMEQNTDAGLQASHLIKLEFKLPADFDNKSVARVPGMIMKVAEQARGDPLAGATAKITSNLFWIALYAADTDKVNNLKLIKERGWIDIPIVYETNKRAMLTLEKAGAGDRIFSDAIAAWGG